MSNKIALVTDSTTYIPEEMTKPYNLSITPSVVIWEGDELRDGVDITPDEFYKRLANAKEMPTTSQPSPGAVFEVFERLHNEGYDILAYMVSEKLSGTLDSAIRARAMLPEANIEVVDGYSASMGTGWPLLEAAEAAKNGASLAECKAIAEAARDHTGVVLMVDTLEFLHRGGRIGGASRFIGTMMNFKPLLHLQEGRIEPLERVRTKKKAIARLIEVVGERVEGKSPLKVAVLNADAMEDAEKIKMQLENQFNCDKVIITTVSPAVGTHTGPGTLGIAYLAGYQQ